MKITVCLTNLIPIVNVSLGKYYPLGPRLICSACQQIIWSQMSLNKYKYYFKYVLKYCLAVLGSPENVWSGIRNPIASLLGYT